MDLPLVPDSWTDVAVTVDGGGPVATGRPAAASSVDPRASFGAVDCADVSAPVLLDNSRTTSRLRFMLPGRAVVLAAGSEPWPAIGLGVLVGAVGLALLVSRRRRQRTD